MGAQALGQCAAHQLVPLIDQLEGKEGGILPKQPENSCITITLWLTPISYGISEEITITAFPSAANFLIS